jgi:glutamate N-acetyltransferase/amino-acid N-acetyltransferase
MQSNVSHISPSVFDLRALFNSWGRILSAAGSVSLSEPIIPSRVSVSFVPSDGTPPLPVLVNGEPENVDEIRAKEILSKEEFEVEVQMGLGTESARYWTCDFSYVSQRYGLFAFAQ